MTRAGSPEGAEGRPPAPVRSVLGVPVAALRLHDVVDLVEAAVSRRRRLHIGVVNAAKLVNMARDPELRDDVLRSDLILADGMAVVWAARLLGAPVPERVAGIDLMQGILRRGAERGFRVYCLGAAPDVLRRATERMQAEHPGLVVAGAWHGYFTAAEEAEVARSIDAAGADVLLVAMTSPKKERFLARWSGSLDVPVWHGVGGSFDVLAGKVRRAPPAWQRLGLEWLYRVIQEPRRLWRRYLVTNTLFCWLVARELARRPWAVRRRGEAPPRPTP